MLDLPEYWQAIAQGIDAEDKKASIFIHHKHSLGVAREAILRDLLLKHTPEPYRVSTGFIYQFNPEWWESLQCDVLVYDPTVVQPDLSIGGLVVVNRSAAKLVTEVKTRLDNETFQELLGIHDSVHWLPVPTLGFAYDGSTFETFVKYLAEAAKTAKSGVPDCIAVHRQNFLFVRSPYRLAPRPDTPGRHRPATHQFVANFAASGKDAGRASATFLQFYLRLLQGQLYDTHVSGWFSKLDLPGDAIVSITDDGEVQAGPFRGESGGDGSDS